jgi:hypothetical protein
MQSVDKLNQKEVKQIMKKRTIILLLLSAVIVYGAVHIGAFMNIGFGREYHNMPMMDMPRHHGPFGGYHDFAFHHGPRGEWMHQGGWMMFGFLPLLFRLAMLVIGLTMVIIGWIVWKTTNRSRVWKWVGLAFMGFGLMALLPKILLIPLGLLVAYVMYKQTKRQPVGNVLNEELTSFTVPTVQKYDFLDEWEKNIQKEE